MHILNTNHEMHIWLCDYRQFDDAWLNRHRHYLCAQEQACAARYLHKASQKCYIMTRILIRLILSEYEPVSPSAWQFLRTQYNRLKVLNRFNSHPRLSFNISHSDGLIAIVLTGKRTVGIDVESYRTGKDYSLIANTVFSPNELSDHANIDEKQFIEYWTLKEAYLKAIGKGLTIPLTLPKFLFTAHNEIQFSIAENPYIKSDIPWLFWLFELNEGYLMSVCMQGQGATVTMHIKQVLPRFTIQTRSLQPYKRSPISSGHV